MATLDLEDLTVSREQLDSLVLLAPQGNKVNPEDQDLPELVASQETLVQLDQLVYLVRPDSQDLEALLVTQDRLDQPDLQVLEAFQE